MPVIVVGADTRDGRAIVDRLSSPDRETRVFVSDESAGTELKRAGFKVAIGDVSDQSHIEAASLNCFSAVLVTEAIGDGREISFAKSDTQVLTQWATAVENAGVKRVIWVSTGEVPGVAVQEVAVVDAATPDLAELVIALDEAQRIGELLD